ncbi:MAG: hypothetical protein ACD_46C00117G0001, partial [uncultured bacterium]
LNGAPPAEALYSLPLYNSSKVKPDMAVFAYAVNMSLTSSNVGTISGSFFVTIYTQINMNTLMRWLHISEQMGYMLCLQNEIAAYASTCIPDNASLAFISDSFPVSTIPQVIQQKINSSIIESFEFIYEATENVEKLPYIVESEDSAGNVNKSYWLY